MKHLLALETTSAETFEEIIQSGVRLKKLRGKKAHPEPLRGQIWGLIFAKSSTRTRVSFEVGIRELGGRSIFLGVNEIQLGRGESADDTARVLSRYLHGVVIRTYAQADIETFARVGTLPVINALTDDEHPCQILADLMTWAEKLLVDGAKKPKRLIDLFRGKKVAFFGDAACNVALSWAFAAYQLGFELHLAAPDAFQVSSEFLKRVPGAKIVRTQNPMEAAKGADLLYTDTWISMGKEDEEKSRLDVLRPFQIHAGVAAAARSNAPVMHCLPAYRGKEITADVFDANADIIFDEAENRLHVQKAILSYLHKNRNKR